MNIDQDLSGIIYLCENNSGSLRKTF